MKIGSSCRAGEVAGVRAHFDYAETYDVPVPNAAYHLQSTDNLRLLKTCSADPEIPYTVIHTDDVTRLGAAAVRQLPRVFVENIPGDQPDDVARCLEATQLPFLFDVGHAYTSALRIDAKAPFDYSRWWALGPKALHFHDCRRLPNPWWRKDAADHQILGEGVLPLAEYAATAMKIGVEFLTLECFMFGWTPFAYAVADKRAAIDRILTLATNASIP